MAPPTAAPTPGSASSTINLTPVELFASDHTTLLGSYSTIQGAVNAAKTDGHSGDEVLVGTGTYNEQVTVENGLTNLTIAAAPGATVDVDRPLDAPEDGNLDQRPRHLRRRQRAQLDECADRRHHRRRPGSRRTRFPAPIRISSACLPDFLGRPDRCQRHRHPRSVCGRHHGRRRAACERRPARRRRRGRQRHQCRPARFLRDRRHDQRLPERRDGLQ